MSYARIRIRNLLEKTIPIIQSTSRLKREAEIEEALNQTLPDEDWQGLDWAI